MTRIRLIASLLLALAFMVPAPAPIEAAQSGTWQGTWAGGFERGDKDGFQIIMGSSELIGLYAGGDYLDDADASASVDSSDRLVVEFSKPRQRLVLTRTGAATASGVLRDAKGGTRAINFKRD